MIHLGNQYISKDKRFNAIPIDINDDEVYFQLKANQTSVLYQRWSVSAFEDSFSESKSKVNEALH